MEWTSVYDEASSESDDRQDNEPGLMESLDADLSRVADELGTLQPEPEPEPVKWQRHRGWHEMPLRLAPVSNLALYAAH